MKKLIISTLLLLLCITTGYAQQKVYIHLNDSTIELYVWQIDSISFAEAAPLTPPSKAERVNLGLSVDWANFNLGAETESGLGYLVGWGDITGRNHSSNNKYFPVEKPTGNIVADKFDIAKKMWGDLWRLPTQAEIQELVDSCSWEWETVNGVGGYRVTGKNTTANIFLPVTGLRYEETVSDEGLGYYWSGMMNTENIDEAMVLNLSESEKKVIALKRYLGCAIRPVYGDYVIPVTITMNEATNINYTNVVISGTFEGDYDHASAYGVIYAKTKEGLDIEGNSKKETEGAPKNNTFSYELSSLDEATTYYYVGYALVEGSYVYSDTLTFTTLSHFPVAEYVDLGLSVKWASWNMGASSDKEVGGYYGWGDATGEETRKSNIYYAVGNTSTNIGGSNYDLAHVKWGDKWRMPTQAEFEELQSCTWESTSNYKDSGLSGWIIYGKKGSGYENNCIFLPKAGFLIDGKAKYFGEDADYWTCECRDDNVKAYYVTLYWGFNGNSLSDKCIPIPIRPVYDEASVPTSGGDTPTPGGDNPGGDTPTPGGDNPGGDTPTPGGDQTMTKGNAVDLGLYVLWADMNVGAENPTDYGNYYAWGEVEPNSNNTYDLSSYKYSIDGATDGDSKDSYVDLGNDIKGTEYDVAHVKWGDGWRMPTQVEVNQLINNCEWTWDEDKSGYYVKGPSGNSIFLPANGYYNGSSVSNSSVGGSYWIGEAHRQSPYYYSHGRALKFTIKGSGNKWFSSDYNRYLGFAVRPVKDKQ